MEKQKLLVLVDRGTIIRSQAVKQQALGREEVEHSSSLLLTTLGCRSLKCKMQGFTTEGRTTSG